MVVIEDITELVSGTPQFRIKESLEKSAPVYTYYGQREIETDLVDISYNEKDSKQVKTFDEINTLCPGDIIFSLISGKATVVSEKHIGYLFTQNYIKLVLIECVDSKYLVYLLNEDDSIKRQFQIGIQGSSVLKYTVKQLRELELPNMPDVEKQRVIGELYFNQLRLKALRNRASTLETAIVLEKIKKVNL